MSGSLPGEETPAADSSRRPSKCQVSRPDPSLDEETSGEAKCQVSRPDPARRIVTVVVAALALPVVLDVLGGWLRGPAALVEHAVVSAAVWPAILLDRVGALEHHPLRVQAEALALAVGLGLVAREIDLRGARRAGSLLAWGVGLPLALAAAALLLVGLALSPWLFGGLLLSVLAGARFTAPARPASSRPSSPSRLPAHPIARVALLLAVPIGLINGASLLASGPGDAQVPLWLLEQLESGLQPLAIPWLAGAVGLAVADLVARGSPDRPSLPKVAAAVGLGATLAGLAALGETSDADPVRQQLAALPLGAAAGGLGAALSSRRLPAIGLLTRDPLTSMPRLAAPLMAAVGVCVWSVATGFGGCDQVRAHPSIRTLSTEPGTFALQPFASSRGDGVLAAFRDQGLVRRLLGDEEQPAWTLDLLNLELQAWADVPEPKRRAFPEELGLDPDGLIHLWVEVPEPAATRLLLLVEPETGRVAFQAELPEACFVSSWAWDLATDEAVAGCEWHGALMRYRGQELRSGGAPRLQRIEGGAELEELVIDPRSRDLLAVGLWSTPWLRRIDAEGPSTVDRRLVGGFNWGLALDADARRLYLPRFQSGRLLVLDADTLEPISSHRAGWGLRPVVRSARHDRVLVASTYDGWLYALDPDGDEPRRRLRLGGWVRDIDLSPGGERLVAGGMCGVLEVDLDGWLGR